MPTTRSEEPGRHRGSLDILMEIERVYERVVLTAVRRPHEIDPHTPEKVLDDVSVQFTYIAKLLRGQTPEQLAGSVLSTPQYRELVKLVEDFHSELRKEGSTVAKTGKNLASGYIATLDLYAGIIVSNPEGTARLVEENQQP